MGEIWRPATFELAWPTGPHKVAGYTYRGLGIHRAIDGSPKGRRPPTWRLTHLGSGHAVANIKGTVAEAFPIATEIAEAGDWTFDGLFGWANQFPDVGIVVSAILAKHAKRASKYNCGSGSDEGVARQIALNRETAHV